MIRYFLWTTTYIFKLLFKHVTIDETSFINLFKLNKHPQSKLDVGHQTMIYSKVSLLRPQSRFEVGDQCFIGNSSVEVAESIKIGNHVLIASHCHLVDHDAHSISFKQRKDDILNSWQGKKEWKFVRKKKIVIKDGAWIGYGCIILKGVTIGERSIVAAGSIVAKSVPPDCIAGGNPAKIIKRLK